MEQFTSKSKDMNDRINGLWWKARIGYNNQNCDPEVLEKFAELIVRECAKAADEGLAEVTMKGPEWPSYYIKKHFGVEE